MINTTAILADLPESIKGMVVRSFDGEECYTIIINSKLSAEQQRAAYYHELTHVKAKDFDQLDKSVDHVEYVRHYAI